ncbi:hypothetical protein DK926_19220 [Rhodococcus sp. Eu-32]|uniref:hypothetical protein n=1 Tax=Rhodococcus sp. Eu-32 TaxID=1017319 RepID=UPI000DF2E504|nr:hypothetical protein [Rhodococcus sp. Eu-32]RRQ26133.1 hypothetical protein DK926_19220 [Rhodococcus sp. Eu-32]
MLFIIAFAAIAAGALTMTAGQMKRKARAYGLLLVLAGFVVSLVAAWMQLDDAHNLTHWVFRIILTALAAPVLWVGLLQVRAIFAEPDTATNNN